MGLVQYDRWQILFGLLIVVGVGAVLRLGGIFHDLPYSFYGDELHFIRRSMAMGTGDLNPHWFNKPAMLMYILLFCYGVMFVIGHLAGRFGSPEEFGAYFLEDMGPFILTSRMVVLCFALIAIWVLFEAARRIHGSALAGWITALAAAALPPLVFSSQALKADIVAGFFVLASVGFYLRTYQVSALKWPILAAMMAGFAMGTKYYGIILIPVFCLAELARIWIHKEHWQRITLRTMLIITVFFGSFLAVSPYSLLDPTLRDFIIFKLTTFWQPNYQYYDPDSAKSFNYGVAALPAATADLLTKLSEWSSIGLPLLILSAAGFAWMFAKPAYRWHACIILGPCLVFLMLCVTIWAFHASPRHFNAIYSLMLLGLFPGAVLAVRFIPFLAVSKRPVAAALLVSMMLVPSLAQTLDTNAKLNRLDSRKLAHDWIKSNISANDRILLDDYGPELLPTVAAIERRIETLDGLPARDAFTVHQERRLDLLTRFPPRHSFNFDELGHAWWHPSELTNQAVRSTRDHRIMGNPLSDYEPKSLAVYKLLGYRYIITNSEARELYKSSEARANHPSYIAFYDALSTLQPAAILNPASWDGKGPTIEIYDLQP